ncbi:MAG: RNHCP domain-containing protein [Chloroflexota bacterium]
MKDKAIAPTRWFDVSSAGVYNPRNTDFRCTHCRQHVSADVLLAGVYNRNHCPYCLWSRHMDWRKPGDRLAACKAQMRPIGLTLKQTRNKYADGKSGELMLIHLCRDCGKISINRIAADDDNERVMDVFEDSFTLERHVWMSLQEQGVHLLAPHDGEIVRERLFGCTPQFG